MNSEESTEIRLIRHWRSGDRVAGDRLLRRYAPVLQSFFSRKVTRNVDDLVQRTLLACVQSIDRFEGKSSFRAYLLGIAHNQFLMSLRNDGGAVREPQTLSTRPEDTPSQLVAIKQEQRILVSALIHLSPEFLTVLKMFYWDNCSVDQIALHLGIRPGTVKSRLARGRAALKQKIFDMNLPPRVRDSVLDTFVTSMPEPETVPLRLAR